MGSLAQTTGEYRRFRCRYRSGSGGLQCRSIGAESSRADIEVSSWRSFPDRAVKKRNDTEELHLSLFFAFVPLRKQPCLFSWHILGMLSSRGEINWDMGLWRINVGDRVPGVPNKKPYYKATQYAIRALWVMMIQSLSVSLVLVG